MTWVLFMVLIGNGGFVETYEFNAEYSCEAAALRFEMADENMTNRFRFAFCVANPKAN